MNVIVVDYERIVLEAETLIVRRTIPKAEVHSFQKANETLEFVKYNRVDIALLNLDMRNITGLELAQQLRRLNPEIKIIFCTSFGENQIKEHDLYASGYLTKPITDEKLEKALEDVK